MLIQLCGRASKMLFCLFLKNKASNSWGTLIDVRSQSKVYLGMTEIPLGVRDVCSYYFTTTRDFALKDYTDFKQFLQFVSMLYDVQI